MAFRLIPREEKFYSDFVTMTEELLKGAHLLEDMLGSEPPNYDKAHQIKEVEHRCDFLTHEVIQRLNRTFVTPIDREDIHELARTLDDVMDAIDATAALLPLYRITKLRNGALELSKVITAQVEELLTCARALEEKKGILEHTVEINRLENEADRIHQRSVGQLFDDESDPIVVMKWKEIFDYLEDATDRCEDVANLLESVVVKHA